MLKYLASELATLVLVLSMLKARLSCMETLLKKECFEGGATFSFSLIASIMGEGFSIGGDFDLGGCFYRRGDFSDSMVVACFRRRAISRRLCIK